MNLPEGFVLDEGPAPVAPARSGAREPRGIRNNNPGNIEDGPFARSIPGYTGSDGRFATYDSPDAGLGAIDRLLQSYAKKGIDTPAGIIGRWAPASDGNPVNAYASYVAQGVGVDPGARLDMSDPAVRRTVAERIAEFENGKRPGAIQRQPLAPPQQAQPPQQSGGLPEGFVLDGAAPAGLTVSERSDIGQRPENAAALESGLRSRAQAMTTGTPVSPASQLATGFMNQGPAASQGTTPDIAAQSKNLISTDVHETDSGDVIFRDPATGQMVPTDRNKHVVLRDPADGRVKVFGRSAENDEGRLSGLGRILLTGNAAGAPTARAALSAAPAVGPGQQVAQAAQRIGVEVPRAVTTDSMAVQRTASGVRNIPLAGDPLVKGAEKAITQLGDKATEVAQGYGGGTVAGAGDAAKGAITQYITGTTAARADKLYQAVDNLIDPAVKTELSATQGAVAEIGKGRTAAALPPGKATEAVLEALRRPGGLTYDGIKTLRTNMGEMLKGGILPEGMSQSELKSIYGALSQDLKTSVRAAGGAKAEAAFERANRYYSLVSDRRAQLAKIVGVDGNAPAEQVFDRLLAKASSSGRADAATLAQARKAIGAEDWNEFASGAVARLGRDPAAVTGPEALNAVSDFSPQRFLTGYGKLSEAGKNILFRSGGKGDLATALDDIAKVSSRFKEMQKFANPSGTAQNVGFAAMGAAVMAEPLTTITSVIGGRALAAALAKPSTASSVAQWSANYEKLVRNPTTPRLAALQLSTRNLLTNMKDVGVTNVSVQDFLKAVQGRVPARAEDEQPKP
jgi:hypothetical protein